jgi:hypothetical protein
MQIRYVLVAALVGATGCSRSFAPVKGKVTMNGAPLPNVLVSFQPIAEDGAPAEVGTGSTGKTDDNGEYSLQAANGKDGAAVGKHRVTITAMASEEEQSDRRHKRGGPASTAEAIPRRYNADSKETFDVPSGGTDHADFPLTKP